MPYNTRHKSLSLPSLGIHVPVTHAERAAAAAAAAASRATTLTARATCLTRPADPTPSSSYHPNKKIKQSHAKDVVSIKSLTPPPSELSFDASKDYDFKSGHEPTPPPSPRNVIAGDASGLQRGRKVDLEGIHDAIVEAVITQLEATANRPLLVKELATVLSQKLESVQQSANPCAIISSRIASYMRRSGWSALSPCPINKELGSAHPRRIFFYLTTCPRQPIPYTIPDSIFPRHTKALPTTSIIESLSEDDEDRDSDILCRRELSPSPEIDLSPVGFHDLDGDDDEAIPSTPVGSIPRAHHTGRSDRSTSPPLEKDEREFTQTANGLQRRRLTGDFTWENDELLHSEESLRDDNMFGDKHTTPLEVTQTPSFLTSPAVRATVPPSSARKEVDVDNWLKTETLLDWARVPEDIQLEELDCLLDAY